jgi:Dna[CI] antecedent DciA-like protein
MPAARAGCASWSDASGCRDVRERDRRRRVRGPVSAADRVGAVLDGYGLTDEIRALRIVTEWGDLVGSRFAAKTWPDGLSKRLLWVRVANSAWLHELSFLKSQVLTTINRALGEPTLVDEVRFHIGGRRAEADDLLANASHEFRKRSPFRRKPLPPAATGARLAAIDRETAVIDDPELRALIRETRRRHDL